VPALARELFASQAEDEQLQAQIEDVDAIWPC
jgi:hypothetical protein